MKAKILAFTLPLLLISCIEVRDADENKEVAPAPTVSQPQIEVSPLSQPHQYAVSLFGNSDMSEVMRKPLGVLVSAQIAEVSVFNAKAEDIINQPGTYEYTVKQGGQTFLLQVEIPQDYVVEGDMKLDQLETNLKLENDEFRTLETSGRLFFKAGSSLTTNGEDVLFNVGMIDSEGATIHTFPKNTAANMGLDGRHGGHIKIQAQAVRGTLHFNMRGENGGDGEDLGGFNITRKPDHLRTNNGNKGGNSGLLEVEIVDQSNGKLTFDLLPGLGGLGMTNTVHNPHDKKNPRTRGFKGQDGATGVVQEPLGLN